MTATELNNWGSNLPALSEPIAYEGDKRAAIQGNVNSGDTQTSIRFGLPYLMSQPLDVNGIPVPREDLNGLFYTVSQLTHYLLAGGLVPYNATVRDVIGGYPNGAVVFYNGSTFKSLVDSNTALPTNTSTWKNVDYLPLSGGTMTGIIYRDGILVSANNDSSYIGIDSATSYLKGAHIRLYGKDNESQGRFRIVSTNGSATSTLSGTPGGALTWSGKNVTLEGDCLPLTGGTMTGAIISKNGGIVYSNSVDTNQNVFIGGSSWGKGSGLSLWGNEHPQNAGRFALACSDGEKETYLLGSPDGSLLWNGSPVFLPVGAVFAYASNNAPTLGALICNGAAVSRTTYANLFASIGTLYGAGDGSTTFNLPNLTNRVIQGSSIGGTVKSAGLPNVTGTFVADQTEFTDMPQIAEGAFTAEYIAESIATADNRHLQCRAAEYDFSASRSNSIYGASDTVQPPALTMRYYIKY